MNALIYILFLSVFFLDYLAFKLDLISSYIAWAPELLSLMAVLIVVMRAPGRDTAISMKYVAIFSALIAIVLVGIATNSATPGTLIVGIRSYLKFLPFFFIPAVYNFTDKQIKRQLSFLLFLALIQGPLGLYQKFVQFGVKSSGDYIAGTLSSGGQLPILMAGVIALLTAFYLRGAIKTLWYVVCLALLMIPVMLSESKASVGYIPLAFLVPIFINFRTPSGKRTGTRMLAILTVFAVVGVSFVAVYDYFAQFGRENRRGGLVEFFTSGAAQEYLNRGAVDSRRVTKTGYVDVILLPLDQLSEEPFKLMFGLGIGSVSMSAIAGLSDGVGDNYERYDISIGSAASKFLWEIGVLGLLLYLAFFYLLYRDAKVASRGDGLLNRFGLGWGGVVMVAGLSLFLRDLFQDGALAYGFWYFSGVLAASVIRQKAGRGVPQQRETGDDTPAPSEQGPTGLLTRHRQRQAQSL